MNERERLIRLDSDGDIRSLVRRVCEGQDPKGHGWDADERG